MDAPSLEHVGRRPRGMPLEDARARARAAFAVVSSSKDCRSRHSQNTSSYCLLYMSGSTLRPGKHASEPTGMFGSMPPCQRAN
jgi:hypothetical protein